MNEPDRGVRGLIEFVIAFLVVGAGAAWAAWHPDQSGPALLAGILGALLVVIVNRSVWR